MTCEAVRPDLDAFVDRELDSATGAVVREHLSGCAPCSRHVAEREALGRIVRSLPYYSAPATLRARLVVEHHRAVSVRHLLTWAAAALLVLSIGAGIGTMLRPAANRSDAVVNEVVDAHVRSLMGDHLFDVRSTDQHTVKPWFLGKLDFAPPVTDLSAAGFPLVGGRLDYLGGQPVAALVYDRRKHTINLFISPERDRPPAATEVKSLRGFHVHHWSDGGMSFWAVSDLNDAELAEFVRAVQTP